MSVRLNIMLSDDLYKAINLTADETAFTRQILLKAFQLYLIARDANKRDLKIGLIDPVTKELKTEIIGL